MRKLKIAILFGGCSEEHHVSVKSAQEIARHLNTDKYDPVYIGISPNGDWMMCNNPHTGWEDDNCCPAVISPDKKTHGLILLHGLNYKILPIDVVFPVIHGKTGEDGAIQGLLELSGIPYVGCGIQSSAACMDKSLAYIIAKDAGIATPEFQVMSESDGIIPKPSTYPVFVKPARSGSSYGVTKVNQEQELIPAVKTAMQFDSKVLIEQAVIGIETGCAVLGNGPDILTSEVDSLHLSHGFFRIHQENSPETGSENTIITVPANLPLETSRQLQETAKSIYRALGCKGLARVDMFLQDNGHILLNEVNTLPGFTSYSRYPRMMAASGIMLSDVIDRLVMMACYPNT